MTLDQRIAASVGVLGILLGSVTTWILMRTDGRMDEDGRDPVHPIPGLSTRMGIDDSEATRAYLSQERENRGEQEFESHVNDLAELFAGDPDQRAEFLLLASIASAKNGNSIDEEGHSAQAADRFISQARAQAEAAFVRSLELRADLAALRFGPRSKSAAYEADELRRAAERFASRPSGERTWIGKPQLLRQSDSSASLLDELHELAATGLPESFILPLTLQERTMDDAWQVLEKLYEDRERLEFVHKATPDQIQSIRTTIDLLLQRLSVIQSLDSPHALMWERPVMKRNSEFNNRHGLTTAANLPVEHDEEYRKLEAALNAWSREEFND